MTQSQVQEEVQDTMGLSVTVDGEEYPIASDVTAGELKTDVGIDDDRRLTYRDEDGIQVLNDEDVIADHVSDGAQLTTRPLDEGRQYG